MPRTTIETTMGPVEWGLLVLLSMLWGGSFFFVEIALREMPTLGVVTCRVGLAALALWAFILLTGRALPKTAGPWFAFAGMGLLNNAIPFTLMVWGQQTIASSLASILNAATPLFTVVVAGLLLPDEKVTPLKLVGVVTGMCGVAVMIGLDALSGLSAGVLAQCAILAGALSYAFAGVFGRRFKRMKIDPIVTAAGQVTASTLMLLPVTLATSGPVLDLPSPPALLALAGLALLSTALAYVIYFTILERAGATNLLLVTFLIPVSAILLGVLVLGERLNAGHAAGMALIGLGLALIDGRLFSAMRRGPLPQWKKAGLHRAMRVRPVRRGEVRGGKD